MVSQENLKKIWQDWNIRGAVLFSLTMQIILIFLAPFRKLSSNRIITLLIWSAYLLADATATSSIGLIIKTTRYDDSSEVQPTSEDFLAFWVPFLLLHLGGPDTITAFALEDNQLWVRHLLALITQGIATVSLFLGTFSSNQMRLPTLLLFVAGIIKYMERTCSLYLASRDRFRNSMIRKPKVGSVNWAKYGDGAELEKSTGKAEEAESGVPDKNKGTTSVVVVVDGEGPKVLDELEIVAEAHNYFKIFKGLIVDLVFSFRERDESRKFFHALTPQDAFRVIEAELNFMYEVLYTKVAVVHSSLGSCFRLVASSSVIVAIVIFHFFIKKHGLDKIDVGVTYALLLGAIGLDGFALLISIFSNWTLVTVFSRSSRQDKSFLSRFCSRVLPVYKYLLDFKKPQLYGCETKKHTALRTPIMFRKWTECVPCFNLVTYCLKGSPVRIHNHMSPVSAQGTISSTDDEVGKFSCATADVSKKDSFFLHDQSKKVRYFLGIDQAVKYWFFYKKMFIQLVHLTELLDELTYISREPLTMELWKFIFDELKKKSSLINDKEETPKEYFSARGDVALKASGADEDGIKLMHYLVNVSYDESLLLWHIATELLYNGEKRTTTDAADNEARGFSKILADYMLYILIWRPTMMSTIAGMAKLRYEDTCADARRFFKRRGLRPQKVKTACKMVLDIDTDFQSSDLPTENESLSVLFKACMLAKEVTKLGDKKWTIISQVWVELLSYGASHCGATAHAQQLSKGGDLISFVWLLMGHFGLLDKFQPNSTLLSPEEEKTLARITFSGFK
ncbi:hypothetical protein M5689_012267 [Euphorbia peplus]|nr:hypothetical protein M5689_012267 [Euphorbia peplus]